MQNFKQKMDICEYYLQNVLNMSNKTARWIQKMRSSYSNFDRKLFYGNSYDFGDFDSCLTTNDDESNNVGKYCLIKYHSNDAIPVPPTQSLHNLKWENIHEDFGGAICIPNTCGDNVIRKIFSHLFNGTGLSLTNDYNQWEFCQIKESIQLNYSDYVIISIISFYLLTILAITWTFRNRKKNESYLTSFSIIGNIKTLFEPRKESMHFLSFLRLSLYFGLVAFHSFFLRAYYPLTNSEKMLRFMTHPFTTILSTFTFGIMGFLVISSALTTRKILKLLDNKSFNFIKMLIERYVRTMIIVAVVIIANIFINSLNIYQAPYYFPDQQSEGCRKNWWTTMLLIQNYYHSGVKDMCAPQAWFLSANFHFFLLTPLVIYPIWRWKRLAFILFPILLIASLAFSFQYTIENQSFLKEIDFFAITNDNFARFYLQSHYLASGWIIGMIVGLIFHKFEKVHLNALLKVPICVLIAVLIFKLILWNVIFEPVEFLMPFDRILASLLCGCIMVLINLSKNEIFTKSLSNNMIWTIVDRVGLSLYIIHPGVIIGSAVIRKQPLTFDIIPIIINVFSDFSISIVLAVILYVLVEEPFIKVTKKILGEKFTKKNVNPQV